MLSAERSPTAIYSDTIDHHVERSLLGGRSALMTWGAVSGHMAQHILLMNVIAPFVVFALRDWVPRRGSGHLVLATVVQIALIWFWHAPPILMNSGDGQQFLMQASLFASALFFWWAVLRTLEDAWWQSTIALLITSKLFCLLGVLLTFSPRVLFAGVHAAHASIADQQTAGLMMLVACPASYLLAAVWISAKGLIGADAEAFGRRDA